MKKLMAFVLSFGLVMLGMAPVMAAGQVLPAPTLKQAVPPGFSITVDDINNYLKQGNKDIGKIPVPEPPNVRTLSDEELQEVDGEWGPLAYIAARGLIGAAVGAIGGAIKSHAETGHIDAKQVAAGAAIGLASGVAGGAMALLPKP